MKFVADKYIALLLFAVIMTSCFTGIESTKKITEKDVAKVTQAMGNAVEEESVYNSVAVDSFPDWNIGKRFYVVDNNIKRIFSPSTEYDSDTLSLEGKTLIYEGYSEGSVLDNEPKVNLLFSYDGKKFVYPTNKTIDEIKRQYLLLQVPFLIDENLIDRYQDLIAGKDFYIRTSIWYNEKGEMIPGKKFVKVKIDKVLPGDKVFPLKVSFNTDNNEIAFVFMSTKQSSIQNRLFDNLFTSKDLRLNYPAISDTNWNHIINGTVALDMTKDECRLALGTPNSIQERPTYDGLQEYWFYGDGMYLVFFDGLLKQFRK